MDVSCGSHSFRISSEANRSIIHEHMLWIEM